MKKPSIIKSIGHSVRGVATVIKEERNFRIHIVVAILAILFAWSSHFNFVEFSLIVIAIIIVCVAEIINTAIEKTWDHLNPSHHPMIGSIKDIMAGGVLVASIGSIAIGLFVICHHFFNFI